MGRAYIRPVHVVDDPPLVFAQFLHDHQRRRPVPGQKGPGRLGGGRALGERLHRARQFGCCRARLKRGHHPALREKDRPGLPQAAEGVGQEDHAGRAVSLSRGQVGRGSGPRGQEDRGLLGDLGEQRGGVPGQGTALEPAGKGVQAEEEAALGPRQDEGAEAEVVQNLEGGEAAHAAGQVNG